VVNDEKKYIMMSMIIQGPKQPGNDIDTYLQLLVDELETLWTDGVKCWDAFKKEVFDLYAMLVQTIHDLPAFGNTSGQKTKGIVGCVTCMDQTASRYLTHSRKTVYMRHYRFLPKGHTYRKRKTQVDGTREKDVAPRHKSGTAVFRMVKDLKIVLGKHKSMAKIDKEQVFKKKSVFWQLPYWQDLDVRHSIDVMHVEKNVCESILGTLLKIKGKTKDGYKARLDMQVIRPDSKIEP